MGLFSTFKREKNHKKLQTGLLDQFRAKWMKSAIERMASGKGFKQDKDNPNVYTVNPIPVSEVSEEDLRSQVLNLRITNILLIMAQTGPHQKRKEYSSYERKKQLFEELWPLSLHRKPKLSKTDKENRDIGVSDKDIKAAIERYYD